MFLLVTAVIGYLLGSLPFGYLVARARGVNIFEVGSKNPGATNVGREVGPAWGRLVMVLDALKGSLAVAWPAVRASMQKGDGVMNSLGSAFSISDPVTLNLALAGLVGAILGHSYSCFTGFRGGKGVATGAGGFIVLFPAGAAVALVVFILVRTVTRYVSLASMLAAVTLPISAAFLHRSVVLVTASAAVALFVALRHRANISRLLAGTEPKVGAKPREPKS